MDVITIQIVSVVAIIGFLCSLHLEIGSLRKELGVGIAGGRQEAADLRERMGRVEGLLEGFIGHPQE